MENLAVENAVSEKLAYEEISKWLDHKNVGNRKRGKKEIKDSIETIVDSICDGDLTLDKNMVFSLKLRNPIKDKDGKVQVDKLNFKPRLLLEEVEPYLTNVKAGNTIGMLAAYCSALTSVHPSILKKIDTDDNTAAQAITLFFL